MEKYDLIIIGAGPSGLTAALYAGRAGYTMLMIEKTGPGGQIMLTDKIDNYPGFEDGISGFELQDKLYKQAVKFGLHMISDSVISIKKENDLFIVSTLTGKTFTSISVILSTGATHRLLGVQGESRLSGKGVSYCGTCDGPFYRNREVVIIGGGDTALTEALFIAKFAKKITIIHRKETFRAVSSLIKQTTSLPNISFIMNSVVTEITGENEVNGVVVNNIKTGAIETLKTDGVFVFVGLDPNTDFVDSSLLDKAKYIITNDKMETSVKGLFAAGDVRSETFRQIVCACSDGAKSAQYAGEFIDEQKGNSYQ
ncbi:MAG: thioredoxin-disulfide reductase [Spirochaetes bacterium GWF1_31_7]|nr:MAG: thioredoxin-disulfide reductase [Spirochaetes bacterium GWE1_32_154]OHD48562.1 MAG: thioredoxin-disulfide reductase [Spirochaetes bacterium GWE2_31_10]OHD50425.1 MAG: thioredoxin-disulfide reductase [Spirochaetes bacterium GWF1_31_7]OHD78444.1 MAG: thioredoxin-disulfide reductase [Spirochaetes bacterium RIFOXYB1_FULL_32_8]HBD93302.1 thioredoxin-disulfide reductase [Spirochaetia bacterium]